MGITFTCTICKKQHPSPGIDPQSRVPKFPSATLTTSRNDKNEWYAHCIVPCATADLVAVLEGHE
jgi:hypothetical protein